MNKKLLITRIVLAVGYIALLAPFIYSVYYSMPANDDFAWAIDWWGQGRFLEMIHRVGYNYMYSFGNSGIFAIMIQVLFNPLYWFNNQGHSFGICMIVVFVLVFGGIIAAVRRLFKYFCETTDELHADVFTFLVTLLLFTSFYYSDVYNWWSGIPGYAFMFLMEVITMGNAAKYMQMRNQKLYIAMIITGMVACTSVMYCVTTGLFYVVYVFLINRKDGDSFIKKAVPLVCYIITGVLMVIAPGIGTRMDSEQSSDATIVTAAQVTIYRVITRAKDAFLTKPWIGLLFLLIIILGCSMGVRKNARVPKLVYIAIGLVGTFISAFGAVLLYVYGSNKSFDSEFTPRIYFVEDYIVFVGLAIVAFRLGQWIAVKVKRELVGKAYYAVVAVVLVLGIANCYRGGVYQQMIPLDIMDKSEIIKESWYFWDEILDEVIAAAETEGETADVVIDRQNVSWCQYSYYVSLDEIPREPLTDDARYGNCNQCASKYYGVRSIIVNLYN